MGKFGPLLCLLVLTGISVGAHEPSPNQAMMDKGPEQLFDPAAQHADPAICAPDGIALGGFDLVSYRQEAGPLLGEEGIEASIGELRYLFVSQENKALFVAAPEKYLPRYSGWCAVTLSLGRLTCPDYTNFRVEHDELLLFETTGFTNGRTLWETDIPKFRRKADDNFDELISLISAE